jgi:hypothetical protein
MKHLKRIFESQEFNTKESFEEYISLYLDELIDDYEVNFITHEIMPKSEKIFISSLRISSNSQFYFSYDEKTKMKEKTKSFLKKMTRFNQLVEKFVDNLTNDPLVDISSFHVDNNTESFRYNISVIERT